VNALPGGGLLDPAAGDGAARRSADPSDSHAADRRVAVAIGVLLLLVVLTTIVDASLADVHPTTAASRRPSGWGPVWRDWRRATSLVSGEPPYTTLRVTTGRRQSGAGA